VTRRLFTILSSDGQADKPTLDNDRFGAAADVAKGFAQRKPDDCIVGTGVALILTFGLNLLVVVTRR
jgi:hypothetical protein